MNRAILQLRDIRRGSAVLTNIGGTCQNRICKNMDYNPEGNTGTGK